MQQTKNPYTKHLFVCTNRRDGEAACCARGGGEAIRDALKQYVKQHGLQGQIRVSQSGCQGLCEEGPNVMVFPDGFWYHHVRPEDVETIVQSHLTPSTASPVTSHQPQIQVILFDLGNVLLPFDHMRAARALAPHARLSPESLYQSFFDSPVQHLHDEGKISGREFYEQVRTAYGLAIEFEAFARLWNDIFWENAEMAALVARLKSRYRLVGISNTNQLHFDYARERYSVVRDVETWVLSHEVGARKPDPAIYRRAIAAAGVAPDAIFYVDDRLDLIEAGRALGLRGEPFINAQRLKTDLARLGVQL